MKRFHKARIAVTIVFIAIFLLTTVWFAIDLQAAMEYAREHDDIFGDSLTAFFGMVAVLPLFLAEVGLYADVMYFLSDAAKHSKIRTVFGVVTVCLSVGTFIGYLYAWMVIEMVIDYIWLITAVRIVTRIVCAFAVFVRSCLAAGKPKNSISK